MQAKESGETMRPRVAIVDDSTMMRQLLRILFEGDDRFDLVGEASDGREILDHLDEWAPEVIILDVEMPGLNGLQALPEILRRRPRTRVIVFSSDPDAREQALASGAAGFLEKGVSIDALLDAATPLTAAA
jgi:two-component system NarL family response regulator